MVTRNKLMESRHDEEVVSHFMRKEKRECYRNMLARPKHRRHVIMELHDLTPVEPLCLVPLPGKITNIESLVSLLKSKGAREIASVISGITGIDGNVHPITGGA